MSKANVSAEPAKCMKRRHGVERTGKIGGHVEEGSLDLPAAVVDLMEPAAAVTSPVVIAWATACAASAISGVTTGSDDGFETTTEYTV